jgi:hypothetical protein
MIAIDLARNSFGRFARRCARVASRSRIAFILALPGGFDARLQRDLLTE